MYKQNCCPESIQGCYSLQMYGKEMILVNKETGETFSTHCHPDDIFDPGAGLNMCLEQTEKKRNTIEVGDIVKVKKRGESYPNYVDWFVSNNIPYEQAARFAYNQTPDKDNEYEVVAIHPHGYVCVDLYLISKFHDETYLVNKNAIEKVVK